MRNTQAHKMVSMHITIDNQKEEITRLRKEVKSLKTKLGRVLKIVGDDGKKYKYRPSSRSLYEGFTGGI